MDDFLAVCILHRFAYPSKQVQTLLHGAARQPAVVAEALALHILHDEPWSSLRKSTGVVEAGNIWMPQLGQQPDLAGESFAARGGQAGVGQEFDGHQVTRIEALGKPDDAHAAFAENPLQPVGTKVLLRNRLPR